MKEVFSKVVETSVKPEEVFNKVKNPEILGEFLLSVPDEYLDDRIKENISFDENGIYLDVPCFESHIKVSEITDKHVRFDVDFPGLKQGVAFVQILPTNEGGCAVRLAIGYKFTYSPIGLFFRNSTDEDSIQELLNDVVEVLVESFKE